MHRTTLAALGAAIAACALPTAAGAATKTVDAGTILTKKTGLGPDADAPQFFPKSLTVRAGDTVKFRFNGFHVVNLPEKGAGAPTLAVPDASRPVTGAKDAAGADFWFNGRPNILFNPEVAFGTGSGKPYTGARAVASGMPEGEGAPKPFTVKFTKTGTFDFFCPIHPGMEGRVKVVGRRKAVASSRADARRVARQREKVIAKLKKAARAKAPQDDVVRMGIDTADSTLLRVVPERKAIKAGESVTFTMSDRSAEIHTVTFARDLKALEETVGRSFVAPLPGTGTGGPPILAFDPRAVYPSDQPLPAYDGTQHGDGFLNTGILDTDPKSPFPRSATVTFPKAGTYEFLCLVHPNMRGKIAVG